MLTPKDFERRRKHWTASDSAKALTGQWGGLFSVIASKLQGVESEATEATDIGNALENPLIDWAAAQIHPGKIQRQVWYEAVKDDYFAATLDALIGPGIILEVTAPGWASDWTDTDEWGTPGTDEVSAYKLIQVHHQMLVTGDVRAFVAAWIRGRGKLLYEVFRDEDLCDSIREYGYWARDTYIATGKLPEPAEGQTALALKVLARVERVPAKRIEPTPALASVVEFYSKTKAARLALEKVEDHTKALILHAMGDASECQLNPKELLTVKTTTAAPSLCECGAEKRAGYTKTEIQLKKGKTNGNDELSGTEANRLGVLAEPGI